MGCKPPSEFKQSPPSSQLKTIWNSLIMTSQNFNNNRFNKFLDSEKLTL